MVYVNAVYIAQVIYHARVAVEAAVVLPKFSVTVETVPHVVVTIDDPKRGEYYGGEVAAPIFSRVVRSAVRLLNIAPDRPEQLDVRFAAENPVFAPLSGLNSSKPLPSHRGSLKVGRDV